MNDKIRIQAKDESENSTSFPAFSSIHGCKVLILLEMLNKVNQNKQRQDIW